MFFENIILSKRIFYDPRFQRDSEEEEEKNLMKENEKLIKSFTKNLLIQNNKKNSKIKKWKSIENLNLLNGLLKIPLYSFLSKKDQKLVFEGNSFFLNKELELEGTRRRSDFIPSIR